MTPTALSNLLEAVDATIADAMTPSSGGALSVTRSTLDRLIEARAAMISSEPPSSIRSDACDRTSDKVQGTRPSDASPARCTRHRFKVNGICVDCGRFDLDSGYWDGRAGDELRRLYAIEASRTERPERSLVVSFLRGEQGGLVNRTEFDDETLNAIAKLLAKAIECGVHMPVPGVPR